MCTGQMWCRRNFFDTLSLVEARLRALRQENIEIKRAAIVRAVAIFFSVKSCCQICCKSL